MVAAKASAVLRWCCSVQIVLWPHRSQAVMWQAWCSARTGDAGVLSGCSATWLP